MSDRAIVLLIYKAFVLCYYCCRGRCGTLFRTYRFRKGRFAKELGPASSTDWRFFVPRCPTKKSVPHACRLWIAVEKPNLERDLFCVACVGMIFLVVSAVHCSESRELYFPEQGLGRLWLLIRIVFVKCSFMVPLMLHRLFITRSDLLSKLPRNQQHRYVDVPESLQCVLRWKK